MSTKSDKSKKKKSNKKGSLSSRVQSRMQQGAMPAAPQYANDLMPTQFVMPGAQAGSDALTAALNQPMPDPIELMKQQNAGKIDQLQALGNSGMVRGVRRDAYGNAQMGDANPFTNGYFKSSEDRMKDPAMTRQAGQYNLPSVAPQQQQAPAPQQQAPAPINDAVNRNLAALEDKYSILRNQTPSPSYAPVTQASPAATKAVAEMSAQYDPSPERLAEVRRQGEARSATEQMADPQLSSFMNYAAGINNATQNLDRIMELDQTPLKWMFGQAVDPTANERQKLEYQMTDGLSQANGTPAVPGTPSLPLFNPPGQGLLPFNLDGKAAQALTEMPGYSPMPWPQPPPGAPAPMNSALDVLNLSDPAKPMVNLDAMGGPRGAPAPMAPLSSIPSQLFTTMFGDDDGFRKFLGMGPAPATPPPPPAPLKGADRWNQLKAQYNF
jgi:hypothetical protein